MGVDATHIMAGAAWIGGMIVLAVLLARSYAQQAPDSGAYALLLGSRGAKVVVSDMNEQTIERYTP